MITTVSQGHLLAAVNRWVGNLYSTRNDGGDVDGGINPWHRTRGPSWTWIALGAAALAAVAMSARA